MFIETQLVVGLTFKNEVTKSQRSNEMKGGKKTDWKQPSELKNLHFPNFIILYDNESCQSVTTKAKFWPWNTGFEKFELSKTKRYPKQGLLL
jgi:hypothetical protein